MSAPRVASCSSHFVMVTIHTNIKRVDRIESSIVEIRNILDRGISLLEKITNNFCPLRVKTILKKLVMRQNK